MKWGGGCSPEGPQTPDYGLILPRDRSVESTQALGHLQSLDHPLHFLSISTCELGSLLIMLSSPPQEPAALSGTVDCQ